MSDKNPSTMLSSTYSKSEIDELYRIISQTLIKINYAASRWLQMQEIKDRRPWWRYRHSHVSEPLRQQHLAWDGMILMHDNPWWHTHFPPNGWGCDCFVETLDNDEYQEAKDEATAEGRRFVTQAPSLEYRKVNLGVENTNLRSEMLPKGIDPCFAFTPGRLINENDDGHALIVRLPLELQAELKKRIALFIGLEPEQVLTGLPDELRDVLLTCDTIATAQKVIRSCPYL